MPSKGQSSKIDIKVDRLNLYREESYTDIKAVAIRCLKPIKPDGSDDDSRTPIFLAQSQVQTPHGPKLLQAMLKAQNFEAALDEIPEAMQQSFEQMQSGVETQ